MNEVKACPTCGHYAEPEDKLVIDIEKKIESIKSMFYSYEDLKILEADYWEELYVDYDEFEIENCDYVLVDHTLYKNKKRK